MYCIRVVPNAWNKFMKFWYVLSQIFLCVTHLIDDRHHSVPIDKCVDDFALDNFSIFNIFVCTIQLDKDSAIVYTQNKSVCTSR